LVPVILREGWQWHPFFACLYGKKRYNVQPDLNDASAHFGHAIIN